MNVMTSRKWHVDLEWQPCVVINRFNWKLGCFVIFVVQLFHVAFTCSVVIIFVLFSETS